MYSIFMCRYYNVIPEQNPSQPVESSAMNNQQQSIIRLSQLPGIVGLSIASIHRMRAAGEFVKPVRLGAQAIGFLRSDVDEWLASRPVMHHFAESIEA